jgi:hypothetical protein
MRNSVVSLICVSPDGVTHRLAVSSMCLYTNDAHTDSERLPLLLQTPCAG